MPDYLCGLLGFVLISGDSSFRRFQVSPTPYYHWIYYHHHYDGLTGAWNSNKGYSVDENEPPIFDIFSENSPHKPWI